MGCLYFKSSFERGWRRNLNTRMPGALCENDYRLIVGVGGRSYLPHLERRVWPEANNRAIVERNKRLCVRRRANPIAIHQSHGVTGNRFSNRILGLMQHGPANDLDRGRSA